MLSTPSLRDSSKTAFETVPIFVCLAHPAKYSKTHESLRKKKKKRKEKIPKEIRNNVIATKQFAPTVPLGSQNQARLSAMKSTHKSQTHYSKQSKCTRPHHKCIADILGEQLKQITIPQDTRRQMRINTNWQKAKAHKRFKRTPRTYPALSRQPTAASFRSKQSVSVFVISSTVRLLPSKVNKYRNLNRSVLCCFKRAFWLAFGV